MPLTLHHLENSQSFRILWLLEELQMPYEVKLYQRTKDLLAPAEYKSLSPLGTSPTITDDFGLSLSESNAIIDYILDKAEFEGCKNELRASPSSPNRNQYLIWFHVPPSSMQFVMSTDSLLRTIPKELPWPLSWLFSLIGGKVRSKLLDPRLKAILELAEGQLSHQDFLGGPQLTAADISAIYSFESAWDRYPDLASSYPACTAWLNRVRNRPAFERALTKSGSPKVALPR